MYDVFASRYSYKIKDFYDLTNRQLYHLLKAINKNKAEEFKFQAALAGKELNIAASEAAEQSSDNPELDAIAKKSMDRFLSKGK